MALTDNTTFYGKDAEGFFKKVLTTGAAKSELSLVPNVKSKIKLAYSDLGNILQAEDCSFSATGEGSLNQKTMEVCDLKVNLEYCATTFEANYLSLQLRAGSNNEEVMPTSYADFVVNYVAEKVASDLEIVLFRGDTGTASYPYSLCDGLVKQLLADTAVIDISATASSITSSNVVTEINRVLNAVPAEVRQQPNFKMFVSQEIAFAYKQAQALTQGGLFLVGDKELNYLGYRLIPTSGLTAKQMIAANMDKVFFLTDLTSDWDDIIIIPQRNISGARTERFATSLKFGVNYLYGNEIVLYSGGTVQA
jgi:hypothetical protein